ncbi:unnamed protein product [Musa banksii]
MAGLWKMWSSFPVEGRLIYGHPFRPRCVHVSISPSHPRVTGTVPSDTASFLTTMSEPLLLFAYVTFLAVFGSSSTPSEARAFFVFGDSLVDSGNNNYLATTARADTIPYGIDSPSHRPTGRFSNGRNIADVMSEVFPSATPTYL